jgi:hypothetical protein
MNDSNRIVIVTTKLVKYKEILKILMFSILKVTRTFVLEAKKTREAFHTYARCVLIVLSVLS